MDFDSLKISRNDTEKANYTATDYSNMSQKLETKIADEKLKVNNAAQLKANADAQKKQKNVTGDEENMSAYKGSYSIEDIKIANEKLKETTRQFSYSVHDKTNQIMIRIKDSDGKVIKEIPSEESLDFYAKLQELSGILLDEKR